MAAEGQHRARLVVQGDARGATRELNDMVKQQTKLERELERANAALAKQGDGLTRNERAAKSAAAAEARLAQQKAATAAAAERASLAEQAAAAQRMAAERQAAEQHLVQQATQLRQAEFSSRATAARQERELIEATTKLDEDGVRRRVAAIEHHRDAQVRAIHDRMSAASGELEHLQLFDEERAVMHRASLDRIAVEGRFREQAAQAEARRIEAGRARMQQASAAAGSTLIGIAGTAAIMGAAVDAGATRLLGLQNVAANLPFSIDKARTATRGLVDDFTLMRLSVMANRGEVAKNAEQMAELADVAVKLGMSVGRDPVDSVERLTMGIAKQEQEILDELGVVVRAKEAQEIYAEAHNKSADALTAHEKQVAFATLAMERARAKAAEVTTVIDGGAGAWARAKVRITNLTDETVLPALGHGIEAAANGFSSFANAISGGLVGTSEMERGVEQLGDTSKRAANAMLAGRDAVAKAIVQAKAATGPVTRLAGVVEDLGDAFDRLQSADISEGLARSLEIVNEAAREISAAGMFSAQTEQRIAAQVHQLDLEEAKLRLIGAAERDIVAVQDTKRALLMEEAALRGDILRVMELIREEELAAVGTRGAGGKVDRFKAEREAFERELAAMHRARGFKAAGTRQENTDAELFERELTLARQTREMETAAQTYAQLRRDEQTARLEAEVKSQQRIRELSALEQQRVRDAAAANDGGTLQVRGADPDAEGGIRVVSQLGMQTQARLDHAAAIDAELQAERTLAEFRLADATTDADRLSAEASLQDLAHREKLNQIEQERLARADLMAERQRQLAKEREITDFSVRFAQQQATAIGQGLVGLGFARKAAMKAAREQGKSEEEARRQTTGQFLLGLGQQMSGLAVSEGVQALVSAASGNFVGAGLHAAAAAAAGVAAGVLTNRGNAMIGSGGESIGTGGVAGAGRGGGQSSNGFRSSSGNPSEIPTSESRRDPRPPVMAQTSGGVSIGMIQINALKPNKQIVREIRDELDDLAYQEKIG
jgi:hypothetical protein